MKSMVFKIVGNVHIVIHGTSEPRDEDWRLYMDAVRDEEQKTVDFARIRTLVFSAGGGPSAKHRREINEFLGGRVTPVAIVTSSTLMRGVVTALQWFNPLARAFSSDNVASALQFLGTSSSEAITVWTEAKMLQSSVGAPSSKSINLDSLSPPGVSAPPR
jgi:hypothetical protein